MAAARPRPSSQVIVDPQELTKFLRESQDFSELVTSTLNSDPTDHGDLEGKKDNNSKPKHRLRPVTLTKGMKERGKCWKRCIKISLTVGAGILFSLSYVSVKKLSAIYHPVTLAFWQFGVHLLLAIPILVYSCICGKVDILQSGWNVDVSTVKAKRKVTTYLLFLATCFCGINCVVLRFVSLKYLTVADLSVVSLSGFLCSVTLGLLVFNCRDFSCVTIIISCFTLFGACIITRPHILTGEPTYNTELPIGVSVALASAVLSYIFFVSYRIVWRPHFSVRLCMTAVLGLLEFGLISLTMGVFSVPHLKWDIFWVSAGGVLSFSCALLIGVFSSLSSELSGMDNLNRMLDVVFSFIFQYLLLGHVPDMYSLIGAAIVLTGFSVIVTRSLISKLSEENPCRKICCCLLK